jgi:septal ring factor EnvC (AmiA/AmiB activator)
LRVTPFLILIATLCYLFAGAFPASAAPKEELSELRSRIRALQKELESAEDAKSDATLVLRQSEQAISTANRKLHELSQQQQKVATTLAGLQKESGVTRATIGEQQERLAKLLVYRYRHGEHDYLKILLNQQDPHRLARHLRYYTYLSRAHADLIRDLRKNLARLDELAKINRRANAELEQIKNEQKAQMLRLEKERGARKAILARINKQITAQRNEIGKLQRDEKRLTALLERLSKMLPGKRSQKNALRSHSLPSPDQSGSPFSRLKGKMSLPVRGELANRYGSPREDSGATWKGLFIRAAAGQEVKAVADGRVVFSDWLRGFGNMVIIDHGDGYMSVYGNNEALYKQAGEPVRAGDAIATVGNSGGIPQTGLYFEMRYQSRPFDPLGWVRLN